LYGFSRHLSPRHITQSSSNAAGAERWGEPRHGSTKKWKATAGDCGRRGLLRADLRRADCGLDARGGRQGRPPRPMPSQQPGTNAERSAHRFARRRVTLPGLASVIRSNR
jgi:hypothetical protein